MRLVVHPPPGLAIEIAPARPQPVDWAAWCAAHAGQGLVEQYTEPDGWSVTIGEVARGAEVTVHAFYAFLDQAVHAQGTVPSGRVAELRRAFVEGRLDWEPAARAPVALAEL